MQNRQAKQFLDLTSEAAEDILIAIENAEELADTRCENNAPFIAFQRDTGVWYLVQGCCNSWVCARCSVIRAKHEYGRIVNGVQEIFAQGGELWFVTITCKGRTLDIKRADDDYLTWTNRFLTAWRTKAKRAKQPWVYVQVTERQKRGAAHSHILCASVPTDTRAARAGERLSSGAIAKRDCYDSHWLTGAAVNAGLGKMNDISRVDNPRGAGTYVAKYLFKQLSFALWPKGWRRIRYSRSFPKAVQKVPPGDAFPIIRAADWNRVRELNKVYAMDITSYKTSLAALCMNVEPAPGADFAGKV